MKKKLYLAIVNKEYKGESNFYAVSPLCKDKNQAIVFLESEKFDFETEFENPWEVNEEAEDNFYLSDNHNNNIWGWVEEIEVETEFANRRFAYTIFHTENVDGVEDNDRLFVNVVFTDGQAYRDKVYQAIDDIVDRFKEKYPSEEYAELDEDSLIENWSGSVGFENDDIDGELFIWFEIHDVI